MSLPVSNAFLAAQASDANMPISKVQLLLGNYLSARAYGTTALSNGDDASGNFPASGAIDGDRTEINVGAASTADNNVGLSSWRSAGVPSLSAPAVLTLTFSQSRTVNRVKLYHLAGHGLSNFVISYWNGALWKPLISTSNNPVAPTVITTTGTLDTVDFPDTITTQLRITVYATAVGGDKANIVELEAYRKVDITSRTKSIKITRSRDYKLVNPMASTFELKLNNNDRFFSVNHVPTALELSQGFINSELRPQLGVLIYFGFNYWLSTELVQVFTGSIDRLTLSPISYDATIQGRDGMKALINTLEFSKLQTSVEISKSIQYALNLCNISNFEMSLDATSITLNYFFIDNADVLTTVRDLVEASADALFYFDENGIATFRNYASIGLSHVYQTAADFQAGTIAGLISATQVPGQLVTDLKNDSIVIAHPTASQFSTRSTNLVTGGAPGSFYITLSTDTSPGYGDNPSSATIGTWEIGADFSATVGTGMFARNYMISSGHLSGIVSGYALQLRQSSGGTHTFVDLLRIDSGFEVTLNSADLGASGGGTVSAVRYANGTFTVFTVSSTLFTVVDTTYSASSFTGITLGANSGWTGNLRLTPYGFSPGDQQGTWTSPALDTGASTTSFGTVTATQTPAGGSITYYTASSPDNVTYTAFVAVGAGGQINSPVHRYLKTRVAMDPLTATALMQIFNITVTWATSNVSKKYPVTSSFTFSFNSTLLNVQQETADNLSGDSSILNDVIVQARPLILTGTTSTVQFQATLGTSPVAISVTNPLSVLTGQVIKIAPYISGGMDISHMFGANPSALAVTFATGAAGNWVCTSVHPTRPVFLLTITATGTITNLQVQGQNFQASSYIQAQEATDPVSVSTYGTRQASVSNPWITDPVLALDIATLILANSKSPVAYLPSMELRPTFNMQLGDRVTVVDYNLDLSADYLVVGVSQSFSIEKERPSFQTAGTLLAVPAGQ